MSLRWQKRFEAHMSLQEEAYCRRGEHEVSKKHGKLRTKYNRFAWGVQAYLRKPPKHKHTKFRALEVVLHGN